MAKKRAKKEIITVLCSICDVETEHRIIREYIDNYDDDDVDYHHTYRMQIVKCKGCGDFSFRSDKVSSDDRDFETGEFDHTIHVYPERGLKLIRFWSSPNEIRSVYEETVNAFNSSFYVLCGAGVRIVIDRICADKGIESGKVPASNHKGEAIFELDGTQKQKDSTLLEGKINGLHEARFLTESHTKALHKLRFIGNASAHSKAPRVSELKIAIKIIEHTLESLYELSERADEIRDPKKKISTKNI